MSFNPGKNPSSSSMASILLHLAISEVRLCGGQAHARQAAGAEAKVELVVCSLP